VAFDMEKQTVRAVSQAPPQAIIGLAPCDLHATTLMDRVFSSAPADPNYTRRRRRTILIGADCTPDEYCFCASVKTSEAETGFDLFLHILRDGYAVRVGTKKGRSVLKKYCSTRKASPGEEEAVQISTAVRIAKIKARLLAAPEELPELYRAGEDAPVWNTIGEKCTGCGSCNHVCPTCYCFDMKDELTLDLKKAERTRHWDACTLEDFARVAGGHDFRNTRSARLRHRMRRKFQYPVKEYNALFCVGCGRCSRTCLVKINITEVTNAISSKKKRPRVSADSHIL